MKDVIGLSETYPAKLLEVGAGGKMIPSPRMTSTLTLSSLEALRTASKRIVHISSFRAFILPGLLTVITATPALTCKPMRLGSLALGLTTSVRVRPLPLRSLNRLGNLVSRPAVCLKFVSARRSSTTAL
jgi:hypothetical protein